MRQETLRLQPAIVGVVPAAGYATRLQPLAGSKELLHVRGRPVIDYLLTRLRVAGCTELRVVTRRAKQDLIEYAHHVGAHVILGEPPTVGDSLVLGMAGLARDDIVLYGFPDTVWQPERAFVELLAAVEGGEELALGLFTTPEPERSDVVVLNEERRVTAVDVKPARPSSPWIYGCCAGRVRLLEGIRGFDEPGWYFDQLARDRSILGIKFGRMIDVGTPAWLNAVEEDCVLEGPTDEGGANPG